MGFNPQRHLYPSTVQGLMGNAGPGHAGHKEFVVLKPLLALLPEARRACLGKFRGIGDSLGTLIGLGKDQGDRLL